MSNITKNFLDFTGLADYDEKVKAWSNSASQVAYKTVAKSTDGNNLLFFKKPSAVVGTDTADVTIPLGGADAEAKLNALAAIIDASATYDSTNHTWSINLDNGFAASTVVGAVNELLTDIGDVSDLDITVGTGETAPADIVAAANLLNDHIDAIADTIANLDGTAGIASVNNGIVTIKGGVKQVAGEIENKTTTEAADVVLAKVATTGAAEDISLEDVGGKVTATDVEGAVGELADAISDAIDGAVVTCETSDGGTGSDILKTYSFYQGVLAGDDASAKAAKKIIDVNIPKDYVVKSADVRTVTTADEPYSGAVVGEKYIDLTINTYDGSGSGTATHLYIPFKDLMDAVKGSVGAEITVTVASDNTISATINSVAATKIVYVAGTGGASDITVKDALDTINGNASTTGSMAKGDADTLAAAIGTNADVKTANTIYGAKAYADDAVNTAVQGLDTDADVGIASVSGDVITIQGSIAEMDGIIESGAEDSVSIAPIAASDIAGLFA